MLLCTLCGLGCAGDHAPAATAGGREETRAREPARPPSPDDQVEPAAPPPEPEPPGPCAGLPASEEPPLALVLGRSSDGGIEAVFCNTSSRLQRVLVPGGCGQRVVLALEHERDGEIEPYDGLSARGCTGRVFAASFRELPAGGHLVAEGGALTPSGDGYELHFGALFFERIARGRVTASAEFISRTDRSNDDGRIESVWLGRLEARPLVLEL